MTYCMSSDKWKIFSIRYTVSTEPNVIFIRFTQMSDIPVLPYNYRIQIKIFKN